MNRVRKQLDSVLIKPAGPDCNLACRYCFYLEKAELFSNSTIHRMTEPILKETTRQVMSQAGSNVSIAWQGGEPTLMGLPFFEQAVAFQKRYGAHQSVGNGLQTNGILIDEKWTSFLREYNFLVGLSLDGPEHIHDHYRLTIGDKGSWRKVFDNAKLLLDSGVEVNALTVVNDYSVQFAHEIYEFHKDNGLTYMQFIPCVETDPSDPTRAAAFSVPSAEYGQFLVTLFDCWIDDFVAGRPNTSIRFFDSVFYNYVDLSPPECTLLQACGVYVVVEHNGDVFSCDFFVEPEWKLGNVMEGNLTDMLNSKRQTGFGQMKADLPDPCKTCEWLKYCWGGCTKDRIRDPSDNGLSHFCQSYKMFFEHADPELRQLADNWKRDEAKAVQREAVLEAIEKGSVRVGRNDPCPCGSGMKFKKCCGANA